MANACGEILPARARGADIACDPASGTTSEHPSQPAAHDTGSGRGRRAEGVGPRWLRMAHGERMSFEVKMAMEKASGEINARHRFGFDKASEVDMQSKHCETEPKFDGRKRQYHKVCGVEDRKQRSIKGQPIDPAPVSTLLLRIPTAVNLKRQGGEGIKFLELRCDFECVVFLQETVKYIGRMVECECTRERRGVIVIILTVSMCGRIVETVSPSDVAIAMIVRSAAALLSCSSGMSTFRSSGYHSSMMKPRIGAPKEEAKQLGPPYAVRLGKNTGPNGRSGPSL
ncbi:hypothetical protein B0H14DRAFT_2610485 [Mycena olivaceomarginata]|nr:hypothetical protein B0H14DRAFT_2610485 [Mycena olivaceomarginata]